MMMPPPPPLGLPTAAEAAASLSSVGLAAAGLASASSTLAALNEAVFATPATVARAGLASARPSSIMMGGGMLRPA